MRLLDWFKNLKWIRAIIGHEKKITTLELELEKYRKQEVSEQLLRIEFREMLKKEMPINCQHVNLAIHEVTVQGAVKKSVFCEDCQRILKHRTSRGVVKTIVECRFCLNTGYEDKELIDSPMQPCRLNENCPRSRKK